MHILSSFIFVFSANIDNFVVGLSYGIKNIRIKSISNILIALISLTGTILSMIAGKIIFNFIPKNMSNSIGGIMLILMGIFAIVKPLFERKDHGDILENPEKADKDNSSTIDAKESITLALALTINNMGLGIGASIIGLNIIITSLLTFIFSILMIRIGYICGSHYLSKIFGNKAEIISALVIIILGLYETFI